MANEYADTTGSKPARMLQVPLALDGQQKVISDLVETINTLEKRIATAMQPEMVVRQPEPKAEGEAPKCGVAGVISENTNRICDCVTKLSGFIRRLEL